MPAIDQQKIDDTRNSILNAAVDRFQHFGISKTTMAEIANDVCMSTANLYRYFKNKEDIAVACAQRCLDGRKELLQSIIDDKQLNASEKLTSFVYEILMYTYNQVSSNPRINELVHIIAEKYPEVVHQKNESERLLIRKIIEQGIKENSFKAVDIDRTTIATHTCIHLFQLPLAMTVHPLEKLQNMAAMTTELVLSGLQK